MCDLWGDGLLTGSPWYTTTQSKPLDGQEVHNVEENHNFSSGQDQDEDDESEYYLYGDEDEVEEEESSEGLEEEAEGDDSEFFHGEQPAQIPPEEAANIQREIWASSVQHLVSAGTPPSTHHGISSGRRGLVLAFSRLTEELDEKLQEMTLFKAATEPRPSWAGGATVLIDGLCPEFFDVPLPAEQLRPWHVVLFEDDEPALKKALRSLPVRVKKLKKGNAGKAMLPSRGGLFAVSDDEADETTDDADFVDGCNSEPIEAEDTVPDEVCYQVKNTFIHFGPEIDVKSTKTW